MKTTPLALTLIAALCCSLPAQGATYTLTDGDASFVLDDAFLIDGIPSIAGVSLDVGNSINQLSDKVGFPGLMILDRSGAAEETAITSPPYAIAAAGNTATLTLAAASTPITMTFTLTDTGVNAADLQIDVTGSNFLTDELHLYAYVDLDLDGTPGNDTASVAGSDLLLTDPNTTATMSTTAGAPATISFQVDPPSTLFPLLATNGTTDDLNNLFNGGGPPVGPEDTSGAIQVTVPGSTSAFSFSNTLSISSDSDGPPPTSGVPEPTTLGLLSCLLLLGNFRRNRLR